jgi:WD40 repeat protein
LFGLPTGENGASGPLFTLGPLDVKKESVKNRGPGVTGVSREERPLDEGDSSLLQFARDLRLLREKAGKPTYRELSTRAHYSEAALSQAAAGRRLPTLPVALAYVRACGGSTQDWEQRWREMAAELEPRAADDRTIPPYAGLSAFQPTDADRFFGRERLVDELVSRMAGQRVVVVVGASGAGKSSLLRAGLIPRLAGPVLMFSPGARPLEECAIRLARLTGLAMTPLEDDRRALHRAVRQALPDTTELVIVVDQLEEVFTLCHHPEERQRFLDTLLMAARTDGSGCRVVLGVRADFYAHCTAFPDLIEVLREGQMTLGPMAPEELRRAISLPAAGSGLIVETALVTELVAQANGQVGVLPLLSHALLETWRRRRGNTLTLAGYRAAGGIEGALAQTAESVLLQLSEHQQDLVKNLMLRSTALGDGTEDTKRRAPRRELEDDPDTRLVLDRLVRARLITLDRDSVEISHEALIAAWPRLRDWLDEDREGRRLHRELTEATDGWEALDRDRGALYRGARLARTHDWAARQLSALTAREREFLDASLAAEQAERELARRRSRRLRQAVALLSVLLLLAIATTTYAIRAQQSATQQRNTALSQVVAGKAGTLRRTNSTLAAQLSLAAYQLAPTEDAKASLLATIPFPYSSRVSGHTDHVNTVAFSPDGRTLLTASHDHTARLWDITDPHHPVQLAKLDTHTSTVNAAAYRPDGSVVATASWDHTAKLWDVTDPRHPVELATLTGHTRDVNAVAFSADGQTLATASTDHTVKLWNVTNPRAPGEPKTLTGHTDAVVAAAFAPDGRTLATAGFDRSIMLWNLAKPETPTIVSGHRGPVTWVAFNADGTRLASASQDSTARIWDTATGLQLDILLGHDRIVRSVTFSPDGLVATTAEDGTARLWQPTEHNRYTQIAVLQAHGAPVVSVAFSHDGHHLATGSDDNTAVLWGIPDSWPNSIDVAHVQAWLCTAMNSPISKDDWARYFPGLPYQPPCR